MRRRGLVLVAGGAALLAAGGAAYATIPDSGTAVIHSCFNKSTGALRVIDPSKAQSCAVGESALSWNGRGLNFRGSFKDTTAYAIGDVVTLNGGTYVAKTASTGTPPPATAWAVLSSPSYANSVSDSNESNPAVFPIIVGSNLRQIAETGRLPAGNYTVDAQAAAVVDSDAQDFRCDLTDTNGNNANGFAETSGPPDPSSPITEQTLGLTDTFTNEPVNTRIILECVKGNGASPGISEVDSASLTATRIGRVVFNGTTVSVP
ncbi:MAG TPA: hypothetical protein VGI87_15160 [Solirubrobacteraceae bacterium]